MDNISLVIAALLFMASGACFCWAYLTWNQEDEVAQ